MPDTHKPCGLGLAEQHDPVGRAGVNDKNRTHEAHSLDDGVCSKFDLVYVAAAAEPAA